MKTIAQLLKHDFKKGSLELYDSNGNLIYFEDSYGYIRDSRPKKSCEGKVVEIDGKIYKMKTALTELIERLEKKIKICNSNNLEREAMGMIEAKAIATELLDKERESAESAFNQARKQTSILGEKDVQMTDYLISPKYKTFEDYWNSKKQ